MEEKIINYEEHFDNDDDMFDSIFYAIYRHYLDGIIKIKYEHGILSIAHENNKLEITFERNDSDKAIKWADLKFDQCYMNFEEFMEQFDWNFYNIINQDKY